MKKFTPDEAAKLFSVPIENVKAQYLANAKTLESMYYKARNTGSRVNGYTATQLKELSEDYSQRSK